MRDTSNVDAPTHPVVDLERRGWEALSSSHGAEFYAEVMSDEGLMVFPGMVLTKQESIAVIREAARWSSYRLEDVRVLPVGDQGAIVFYRAVADRAGRPTYDAMMTSVYVLRAGTWKLILHQQSPASV
jgi:hypothetical protein